MATCEFCVCYEACVDMLKALKPEYKEKDIIFISTCNKFKNKADFVEVVRCEKCDYKDDCARQMVHTTRDYILEQNISTYNKVDFCSFGERREQCK